MKYCYELKDSDVGKDQVEYITCKECNTKEKIYLASFFGRVQKNDIGKRIYKINGIFQIENNNQRDKRCT